MRSLVATLIILVVASLPCASVFAGIPNDPYAIDDGNYADVSPPGSGGQYTMGLSENFRFNIIAFRLWHNTHDARPAALLGRRSGSQRVRGPGYHSALLTVVAPADSPGRRQLERSKRGGQGRCKGAIGNAPVFCLTHF